jgi:hypothetical protein
MGFSQSICAENTSRAITKIDAPATNERATVGDANLNASAYVQIRNSYSRAKRQGAMRRRHCARVQDFTVGSSTATVAVTDSVMRGDAGFGHGNGRRSQERDRENDAEHSISFGWRGVCVFDRIAVELVMLSTASPRPDSPSGRVFFGTSEKLARCLKVAC